MTAQLFKSSSRERSERVRMMYRSPSRRPAEGILPSASDFVPDDVAIRILIEARRRGVRIDIILPTPSKSGEIVPGANGSWSESRASRAPRCDPALARRVHFSTRK